MGHCYHEPRRHIGHHCQRLDLWWGWLLVLGESLFFFHPLVWLSRAEWRLTQELACDALAVRAAKSRLAEYGTMLLEVSTSSNGVFAPPRSITVFVLRQELAAFAQAAFLEGSVVYNH